MLDVAMPESIPAVVQSILKRGRIDVLVDNAGWAAMAVFEDSTYGFSRS